MLLLYIWFVSSALVEAVPCRRLFLQKRSFVRFQLENTRKARRAICSISLHMQDYGQRNVYLLEKQRDKPKQGWFSRVEQPRAILCVGQFSHFSSIRQSTIPLESRRFVHLNWSFAHFFFFFFSLHYFFISLHEIWYYWRALSPSYNRTCTFHKQFSCSFATTNLLIVHFIP